MLETDYLMFPFICRYLEKKLKEISVVSDSV